MNVHVFIFPNLAAVCRFVLVLVLFWVVILVSSCTTVQVSQDYDPSFPFQAANTFGWNTKLQHENSELLKRDELLAKRFKTAIENVLAPQGFLLDEHPTFLVSYTFSITNKLQIDSAYSSFGYGFGSYGYHRGVGITAGNPIRQYDQGELVIYIHSATTNQLLWKGRGTRDILIHSDPDQITRSVHEIVEAVLAQFPPLT